MFRYPGGPLFGLLGLSNFYHPWGGSLLTRSRGMMCPTRLAGHIIFAP